MTNRHDTDQRDDIADAPGRQHDPGSASDRADQAEAHAADAEATGPSGESHAHAAAAHRAASEAHRAAARDAEMADDALPDDDDLIQIAADSEEHAQRAADAAHRASRYATGEAQTDPRPSFFVP